MEQFLIKLAYIFRMAPSVRGKFRIAMLLEALLLGNQGWRRNNLIIRLKNGQLMNIDPRSAMHKVPLYCGEYDDEIINKFASIFSSGWTVLDIGASIGYWTIPFLKKIELLGSGKVESFEPLPKNYERLIENISVNDLKQYSRINNFALGDFDGSIQIHATEKGDTGNAYIGDQIIEGVSHNYHTNVQIRRLDSLIDNYSRCDLIKMDIEGAEIFVIKGGLGFLKKFNPIIYGEFNSLFLDNYGFTILDVQKLLLPLGYVAFKMSQGKFISVDVQYGMQDILFVPSTRLGEVNDLIS